MRTVSEDVNIRKITLAAEMYYIYDMSQKQIAERNKRYKEMKKEAADAEKKRINALIKDIERSYFQGIGKPEPLKYRSGWSRRIDDDSLL